MNRRISYQLLRTLLFSMTSLFVLYLIITTTFTWREKVKHIESEIHRTTGYLSAEIGFALWLYQKDAAIRVLENEMAHNQNIISIAVFDAAGDKFASVERDTVRGSVHFFEKLLGTVFNNKTFKPVQANVHFRDHRAGSVLVRADRKQILSTIGTSLFYNLLQFSLFMSLGIVVISTGIYRHILKPLHRLTKSLAVVGEGNLQPDISLPPIREWQAVQNTVSSMALHLRRLQQHLVYEARELEAVIDAVSDAIIAVSESGGILFANEAAQRLLNSRSGSIQHARLNKVCSIQHKLTGSELPFAFEEAIALARPFLRKSIVWLVLHSGEKVPVVEAAYPLYDTHGKLLRIIVSIKNMSDFEQREEGLIKLQKLESLAPLAGGIAHDFNNYLTAIVGRIQMARFSGSVDAKSSEQLKEAEKAVFLARDLATKLLAFSKGNAPMKTPGNIASTIRDATSLAIAGTNSTIRYSLDKDLAVVSFDEGQIKQAISNIVINAHLAMPEGGLVDIRGYNVDPGQINLSQLSGGAIESDQQFVAISIQDSGPGIDPKAVDKIFDPYFTTRSSGNGLGLAITYRIITNHGGVVIARNGTPQGAQFIIYLPAFDEKNTHAATLTRTAAAAPEQTAATLSGSILILEDDVLIQDLLREYLRSLAMSFDIVGKGEDAVDLYRLNNSYDLVFLDLTIRHGRDGFWTIEQIKNINPGQTVIAMTGYSENIRTHYSHYGFIDLLSKPFTLQQVTSMLSKHLQPKTT